MLLGNWKDVWTPWELEGCMEITWGSSMEVPAKDSGCVILSNYQLGDFSTV